MNISDRSPKTPDQEKALERLTKDLGTFNSDSIEFIADYYDATQVKMRGLTNCMIDDRRQTPEIPLSCREVKKECLSHVKYRIQQRANTALTQMQNPWIRKHEQNSHAGDAAACLFASNHIEDVLFAAGSVVKHGYSHGVDGVLSDIDALITVLPSYPSLLNDAQKGRFLSNLNELKEVLRNSQFEQAQSIIQNIKNDLRDWV